MSRSAPPEAQTHLHVVVVVVVVSKQKAVTRARATFIHCVESLFMVRVRLISYYSCVCVAFVSSHTHVWIQTRGQ